MWILLIATKCATNMKGLRDRLAVSYSLNLQEQIMSIFRVSRPWTAMVAMASLASVLASANLRAAIVVLNVNSGLSSLDLTGPVGGPGTPGVGGIVYMQQSAGSLVAQYGGTITADLTAGVFTFSGGSAITAIVNPNGPFTSAPNSIGVEAGNYGITANGLVLLAGAVLTVNGVYKDLVLDITAGTAQNGAATGATMNFSAGALDFGVSPAVVAPGTASLVGSNGLNTSPTQVSWDGTTLRIPVAFQTTGGTGRVENWSGTIVGTIVAVPEPSSIALMSLVGVVGLSYASIRTRRAKRLLYS